MSDPAPDPAIARERRIYAGIGSREAPANALQLLVASATRLAHSRWTLRTGLSPGADQAFYKGALAGRGRVELFLPCRAFQSAARRPVEEGDVFVLGEPSDAACSLAARFHPQWSELSPGARRLRARDVHQVLGRDLAAPATLVVCWTEDGSLDGSGQGVGGSGQALRVAHDYAIPVLNLSRPEHLRELSRYL